MTRWNASTSTFTILHLLLTLSQPIFAAAFRFHARHDGKSHKNHIHRDIDARQNIPNAPFAGIGIISDPGATLPFATTATTASPPPPEQFETISAMDTAGFGGAGAPSMASMSAASASNSQSTIDPFASPVFPITVIQVPIYTICPDAPGNTNLTSAISPNATAQYSNAVAGGNATQRTSATPIPFNATTLLSNNSSPAIPSSTLPTTTPTLNQAAVPNARIILNPNGCQTLYSASTTQICSKIITRGGQLPITVSDCSQWVTFSSSTLTSALPSPTATAVCNCPNTPVATQLLGGNGSGDENDNAVSSNSTLLPIHTSPNATNGNNNGIAFFAAPWHIIAAGAIPDVVQVVSGNNNNTSSERWSVSTSTKVVTGVKTVRFEGVSFFLIIQFLHFVCIGFWSLLLVEMDAIPRGFTDTNNLTLSPQSPSSLLPLLFRFQATLSTPSHYPHHSNNTHHQQQQHPSH